MRRPGGVIAVALALWFAAVLAVVIGVGVSAVSNCCGSPDQADGRPIMIGLAVGAAYFAAGGLLWWGAWRPLVAALTASAPAVVLMMAGSSSDALGMVVLVFVLWFGLCSLLLTDSVRAWCTRQRPELDPDRLFW